MYRTEGVTTQDVEVDVNETAFMLEQVGAVFDDYVAFPSEEARDAVVLWTAHTHVFRAFDSTPRLAVLSNEPGCGKSRVLEVIEHLVPNPVPAIYVHPAILWRAIEHGDSTTLLLDEVDTIFGRVGSNSSHAAVRSIINAGHRKGGTVPRCVGSQDLKHFNVFAPIAMAGLGILSDTILSRSVVIPMKRRRAGQIVQQFRERYARPKTEAAKFTLEEWSDEFRDILAISFPDTPVTDRQADVWEPLIAIADLAGDEWHERAVRACKTLISSDKTKSMADVLLIDLQDVFGTEAYLTSAEILERLYAHKGEVEWTEATMDQRKLGMVLRQYGVPRVGMRDGDRVTKGYRAQDMARLWPRKHEEEVYVDTNEDHVDTS